MMDTPTFHTGVPFIPYAEQQDADDEQRARQCRAWLRKQKRNALCVVTVLIYAYFVLRLCWVVGGWGR